MTYSGSGDVTASAEGMDLALPPGTEANTSTSGCEATDFSGFTTGNIAVIQRGSCSFGQKAQNAEDAGAIENRDRFIFAVLKRDLPRFREWIFTERRKPQ
jgi:hypothetical protein